jgi:hypothetical protein
VFLRIRDVYPGSRILIFTHPGSRISDPGSKTATKEKGEKNLLIYLFCSHNFHKIENYFIFEMLKKKRGQFSNNCRTLPKKLSLSSQKYGFGIRDPEKTYSGSRSPKGTGSRIPDSGL